MTFRSNATEGVWSPTQNVAVQTEANVVAIFFFHQCGFYDPTHHIRGCQKIIWNFALKGRALSKYALPKLTVMCNISQAIELLKITKISFLKQRTNSRKYSKIISLPPAVCFISAISINCVALHNPHTNHTFDPLPKSSVRIKEYQWVTDRIH